MKVLKMKTANKERMSQCLRMRDRSALSQLLRHWEAGGVSMHLTLMFQLCIAQSQNQTGHELEEV